MNNTVIYTTAIRRDPPIRNILIFLLAALETAGDCFGTWRRFIRLRVRFLFLGGARREDSSLVRSLTKEKRRKNKRYLFLILGHRLWCCRATSFVDGLGATLAFFAG